MSNGQDQNLMERLRERTGGAIGTDLTSQPSSQLPNMAAMMAAQAKAGVEARFTVAQYRQRSWDDCRILLLAECRRPGFAANKSVYYTKPVGGGQSVSGLGIRFAEAALRCMRNVLCEQSNLHDDDSMRIIELKITDLETNQTMSKVITLVKTVERSKPADDGTYSSVRTNTQGRKTYTVPATEDSLLNKEGALVSKALRVLALRILPGDIQDECEAEILRIRKDTAAQDPNAERKRIADAFAEINVRPSDLSAYLGHDFGACSPAELVRLRGLYGAIRDGETTWATVMEEARGNKQSAAGNGSPAPAKGSADPEARSPHEPGMGTAMSKWPQQGTDGLWRDSTGATFREDQHGWNTEEKRPSVTEKGVFRARRGTGQGEAPGPPTPRTDRSGASPVGPPSSPATTAAHERASSAQQERGLREEEGW